MPSFSSCVRFNKWFVLEFLCCLIIASVAKEKAALKSKAGMRWSGSRERRTTTTRRDGASEHTDRDQRRPPFVILRLEDTQDKKKAKWKMT